LGFVELASSIVMVWIFPILPVDLMDDICHYCHRPPLTAQELLSQIWGCDGSSLVITTHTMLLLLKNTLKHVCDCCFLLFKIALYQVLFSFSFPLGFSFPLLHWSVVGLSGVAHKSLGKPKQPPCPLRPQH
jgi:hypothetical protein